MAISTIKHTHKTILFEEFNLSEECDSLDVMLADEDNIDEDYNVIADDMIQAMNKLTVHSFKEFVEKFVPYVYQEIREDENGNTCFEYKFGKDYARHTEVKLTEKPYFKTLLNLYMQKGASGESNVKFDYNDILQALMPEGIMRDYRKKRSLLLNYTKKYYEAKDSGRDTAKYKKILKDNFSEVKKLYEKDLQGMLPILIDDTKRQLEMLGGEVQNNNGTPVKTLSATKLLALNDDGFLVTDDVKLLPEKNITNEITHDYPLLISTRLEKDYDKIVASENRNDQIRSLIVRTFSPAVQTYNQDMTVEQIAIEKKKLLDRKVQYETYYRNSVQSFITNVYPLIKKIIGVYCYFEHATVDGNLPDGLIVANCTTGDLLNQPKQFKAAMKYLGTIASDENKIWMAILPRVNDGEEIEIFAESEEEDFFEDDDSDLTDNLSTGNDDRVPEKDVVQLLNILGESHILTFFSYMGSKVNTFNKLSPRYIDKIRNQFADKLDYPEYASCVYPNFTLMDGRSIAISDGKLRFIMDDGQEATLTVPKLQFPAMYIDACYVAAGLVAGSQQHKYLWNHGFSKKEIDGDLPCVHINLEDLRDKLITNINRELTDKWDSKVRASINDGSYGFVFCSDRREVNSNGEKLKNAYVYCARTLKKGAKSGTYMSIHSTLVTNYLYARLSNYNNDIELLMNEVNNWRFDKENKKDCINLILSGDDDVYINEETDHLHIKLMANKKVHDDIEIKNEEV